MKHIVSFSGGVGSYMAGKRVIEQHGVENTLFVFTDTKIEDPDLYRFMDEVVGLLGVEFLKLEEGRDVWEVFFDEKYIGNTRNGNCTRRLKQEVFRTWLESNYGPDDCVVYLGFDWTEPHRYEKAVPHWKPYTVKAPMCDAPYITKDDIFRDLKNHNIEIPYLYKLGFQHNNCGAFCVKAGHGHFKLLLEKLPDRYAYHEAKEKEWQEYTGKHNTVLKNRRGGTTKPMTLEDFRKRIEEENVQQLEFDDFGGCGCFGDFE